MPARRRGQGHDPPLADDAGRLDRRRARSPSAAAGSPAAIRARPRSASRSLPGRPWANSWRSAARRCATGLSGCAPSASIPACADVHCSARMAANTPRQSFGTATGGGPGRTAAEAGRPAPGPADRPAARGPGRPWAGPEGRSADKMGASNASQILFHQQQQVPPRMRLVARPMEQLARVEWWRSSARLRPCGFARAPAARACPARRGPARRRAAPAVLGLASATCLRAIAAHASSSLGDIFVPGASKQASEAAIGLFGREPDRGQHPHCERPRLAADRPIAVLAARRIAEQHDLGGLDSVREHALRAIAIQRKPGFAAQPMTEGAQDPHGRRTAISAGMGRCRDRLRIRQPVARVFAHRDIDPGLDPPGQALRRSSARSSSPPIIPTVTKVDGAVKELALLSRAKRCGNATERPGRRER